MSRYYSIVLTNGVNGNVVRQYASTDTGLVSGQWMPAARQVELDLPVSVFRTPVQQPLIRIHGISMIDISQAANFVGLDCQVFGGMSKGLPLANPAQSGLLTRGMVYQSFANWVGTDMALDLVIVPLAGSDISPSNLVLDWQAGQTLGDAVGVALQTAFPNSPAPVVMCSPLLVRDSPATGKYESVAKLAIAVKQLSLAVLKSTPGYSGVDILVCNDQWTVFDNTATSVKPNGSTKDNPRQISYLDMIGQATWIEPATINFNCPMRADIGIGDFIQLPKGPVTTLGGSQPQARSKTAFAGVFQVTFARHLGNYRQADGTAWISTFNAITTDPSAQQPPTPS